MANNKDVIKVNLSAASFRRAAKRIRRYADSLDTKCQRFCWEVAKVGYEVIESTLAEHVETGETIGSITIEDSGGNGHYKMRVIVSSDAILFLEFGSGLIGEGTAPHAAEFGMGSGTYEPKAPRQNPQFDNWENPKGWFYYGDDGSLGHTYGMVASMPMYNGGKEMERQLEKIARKVFR